MERVLVVEDCGDMQALIRNELEPRFEIRGALTLADARNQIQASSFDAILLDVGLPDGSGFEFCDWLRSRRETEDLPILFLTGKSQGYERVMGFTLGADDYIIKPVDTAELQARLQTRIKGKRRIQGDLLMRGPFRFDRNLQRVSVTKPGGGTGDLRLTPFEFRLLYLLASREPEVFSRSALLKNIVENGVHVSEETVYTHVSSLRRKLGGLACHLESVARIGYRFCSSPPAGPAKSGD